MPLIPPHIKYTEPFLGGGAVYWTKEPSPVEIINDMDGFVANFYQVIKSDFESLRAYIDKIPISRHDSPDAFHFIDPPYFNANMGHYSGYTDADFKALLELLGLVEGKFLLTCYPSDMMEDYAHRNGWTVERIDMSLSAGAKGKRKVECLVRNYTL